MSTRTRPANGAAALAEMREFAGFGKGTQRYIRRALESASAAATRSSLVARPRRSRRHPRSGTHLRPSRAHPLRRPDDKRARRDGALMAPLITMTASIWPDRLPCFASYASLRAPDRRQWAVLPGVLPRGLAASPSRPAGSSSVDQRGRGDGAGLVEPRTGLLPEWVERSSRGGDRGQRKSPWGGLAGPPFSYSLF